MTRSTSSHPHRRFFLFLGLAASGALACNALLGIEDVELDPRRDSSPDRDSSDIDTGFDAGGDPTCAPSPRDDATVIREACGIFVVPTGSDADEGSRAKPVRTLRRGIELAGLKSLRRVYLCTTTYPEMLDIGHDQALLGVSLYGGLACGSWVYDGTRAVVKPAEPSVLALRIDDALGQVTLEGIDFIAADAVAPGGSSVAGYVRASASVVLRYASFAAGIGKNGAHAPAPTAQTPVPDVLTGSTGRADGVGGDAKTCTCLQTSTSTVGGKGGNSDVEGGGAGSPGAGGAGGKALTACGAGGDGAPGASGASGKHGGDAGLGSIEPAGWLPSGGNPGDPGSIGQGGGGGRGGECATPSPHKEGGGGGGCGSCGGSAGRGGTGGGSSIALLIKDSTVSLTDVALSAKTGGTGGNGAGGLEATTQGNGGDRGPGLCACVGGAGGKGGRGGNGGGGAGGLSAGIVYGGTQATPPVLDDATRGKITVQREGAGGAAGGAGAAPGRNGIAQQIVGL